jgi:hypothetical protein
MTADLRERVARAIEAAYSDFPRAHPCTIADAVLAELGLTQAEPVAWSLSRFICDDDGRAIGTDETEVRWQSECPDADEGWAPLYAAPQPRSVATEQVTPAASAEDVMFVDELLRQSGLAGPTMKDAWQRIRASLTSATPTTGVGK